MNLFKKLFKTIRKKKTFLPSYHIIVLYKDNINWNKYKEQLGVKYSLFNRRSAQVEHIRIDFCKFPQTNLRGIRPNEIIIDEDSWNDLTKDDLEKIEREILFMQRPYSYACFPECTSFGGINIDSEYKIYVKGDKKNELQYNND